MARTPNLTVHTLGPVGTNCEAAAHHWLDRQGLTDHAVVLHPTLEKAAEVVKAEADGHVLLGCVVYPDLHHLVFRNLGTLRMLECFVLDTWSMVVAGDMSAPRPRVASHPAPADLLGEWRPEIVLVDSNSEAALLCAEGKTDACVTTSVAADAAGLPVVKDFGPVPMGFSIHGRSRSAA
ncbi:hypothetical protein [Frankia gtarii]|uniref:hypothetical protein n=1 Tax=Frankia gtarii TaxID=2950102 RepID=UPI0021C249FB|nr:hypothetical protein [Frankia gtarii]